MTAMYVKLDMTHEGYQSTLEACRVAFNAAYPSNLLATVTSPDQTQQWVETVSTATIPDGGPVLATEVGSNDMVQEDSAAWTPPPDNPA